MRNILVVYYVAPHSGNPLALAQHDPPSYFGPD
jgi:hypothetical protein